MYHNTERNSTKGEPFELNCLLVFLPVKHIKMMQFSSIRLRQNAPEHQQRTLVVWRLPHFTISLIEFAQEVKQVNCSYLQSLCVQSQDTLDVFEVLSFRLVMFCMNANCKLTETESKVVQLKLSIISLHSELTAT